MHALRSPRCSQTRSKAGHAVKSCAISWTLCRCNPGDLAGLGRARGCGKSAMQPNLQGAGVPRRLLNLTFTLAPATECRQTGEERMIFAASPLAAVDRGGARRSKVRSSTHCRSDCTVGASALRQYTRGKSLRQDRTKDGCGEQQHQHRVQHLVVQQSLTRCVHRIVAD